MIKNYLKIGFRSLRHQGGFSLINILGLATALMVIIFLILYHHEETTFDQFHSNHDRIYRIVEEQVDPEGGRMYIGSSAPPLGKELVSRHPEFLASTSITNLGQSVMVVRDNEAQSKPQNFNERDYYVADPNFFKIFSYPFLYGHPDLALASPNAVVLTQRAAIKYFGHDQVMGYKLINNRTGELTVTGIVENPPKNSHLDFDFLLSVETFMSSENGQRYFNSWDNTGLYHYILADRPLDIPRSSHYLKNIEQDFLGENLQQRQFHFQALRDIHFGSNHIDYELRSVERSKRNPDYLKVFAWIGLLVLIIACINYVNLATARSIKRSMEISVRKIIGASRNQLFGQFMAESILTSLGAGLLGLILSVGILPYFNKVASKNFHFSDLFSSYNLVLLSATIILVGFISGLFPALILSNMKVAQTIRGTLGKGVRQSSVRKTLVIFQFVTTISIIASTGVIYQQLQYIQEKDLGFDKEHLVTIDINSGIARSNFERFKEEFLKHPTVSMVAATSRVPGEWKDISHVSVRTGQMGAHDSIPMHFFGFDEDAIATFDMSIAEGRNFTGNLAADSSSIILNQTAVRQLNLDDPIGDLLYLADLTYPMQVIGVVEDFHVESLHKSITPLVVGFWNNPINSIDYFTCRINPSNTQATLAHLQDVQSRLDPETPLEYHFLDHQINRFYQEDYRVSRIFLVTALLTLFIACLGLFGLITYSIGQRIKEVGIRKILGATGNQLWILLSRDILQLILISLILAIPISWYFMQRWLREFAFTIEINFVIFLSAGLFVLIIALLSVNYHLMKVIRINPVNTLRQ